MKQIFTFTLVFIIILSFNNINLVESSSDSSTNLAVFSFTGNNVYELFDYNNDSKEDYIIINMEVNVSQTGFIQLSNPCDGVKVYWNSNESYKGNVDNCALFTNIIHFYKIGLENITMYFGFGAFLSDWVSPPPYYVIGNIYALTNVNVSQQFNYYLLNNDGLKNGSLMHSPYFNFTLNNIQNYSYSQEDYQNINPAYRLSSGSNLIQGRSLTNEYTWNLSDKINNVSELCVLHFTTLSESVINYSLTYTYVNGSIDSIKSISLLFKNQISLGSTGGINFLIPQNINQSAMEIFSKDYWMKYLQVLTFFSNTPHIDISYFNSNEYFGSEFNGTITLLSTTLNYHLKFKYHTPTGLLTYFKSDYYSNSSKIVDITYTLVQPDVNKTETTQSTSYSSESITTKSVVSTTSYLTNYYLIALPIILLMIIGKFRKKRS